VAAPIADAVDLEDEVDFEVVETNYALALTEALEAISAAQAQPVEATYSPVRKPHAARPAAKPAAAKPASAVEPGPAPVAAPAAVAAKPAETHVAETVSLDADDDLDALLAAEPVPAKGFKAFVAALDKLPPIRLPIGPAIPWRYGLPLLFGALLMMVVVARPQGQQEKIGTSLPAQQTYAVQHESPLFANAKPAAETTNAPVGVAEPAATAGFDLFDVGIKFAAVLGLAYGSMMLLKKVGLGGRSVNGTASMAGVRVVSSLALAPNRTVHVIRTPGGKSLLVGATPQQVNLIADLGELDEDTVAVDSGSFFDILSSKLAK